jgi:hypothetical protein
MARDPRIALDDMAVAIDRIAEETEKLTFGRSPKTGAPSTSSSARS